MEKELLKSNIAQILFQVDPMGVNYEDNKDEYDIEADAIANRISGTETAKEIETIIKEEFIKYFGNDIAESKIDKYNIASYKIYEIIKK